ncbi:MAG TPA: hypothetical protein PLZ08_04535 [Bacillota bacterium]|nr:hypothetical protein [Bacillota bacterium]HOL10207.1 hypothetical protein [Bacillota bacterium]HPO97209.1 hypothetical protein [Bacillota bacterium]
MACYYIMTALVNHRSKNASKMQEILTKSGCIIKMRLGLHEAENVCSEEGLIILQLTGDKEAILKLEAELNTIDGVKAKLIELCS